MKLTQPKKVLDIVRPCRVGIRPSPAVGLSDSVTRAIEVMLQHDLKSIAVMTNGRLVGCVELSQALNHLGLRMPAGFETVREAPSNGTPEDPPCKR